MAATFAQAVVDDRVPLATLRSRYRPVLELVDVLIGVVPNCDPYLEIWPPGFRTYNLMVPNFLNLPSSLVGVGAPKATVGLAMYAASRAASCNYCSAHTCSFALRRGAGADAVTGQARTPGEAAAIALGEALSAVPHHFDPSLAADLRQQYSAPEAEWIVMGVAMMGFLNKFMDAVGIELEQAAVDDVAGLIGPTGWVIGQHGWDGVTVPEHRGSTRLPPRDSAGTLLRVARFAPGALRLDRRWRAGIPTDPRAAHDLIAGQYHFDVPVLMDMTHARPRRALTAMLRDNLDPAQSAVGIGVKALAGLVFAHRVGNASLAEASRALATAHTHSASVVAAAQRPVADGTVDPLDDPVVRATLLMADAIAPSPSQVETTTIAEATAALTAPQMIEVAVWVSVMQLLHRLSLYYGR